MVVLAELTDTEKFLLGNLGTGTKFAKSGEEGFACAIPFDTANRVIRHLGEQGLLEVLSCPRVLTTDNQAARIHVGDRQHYVHGSCAQEPLIWSNINDFGVPLFVTPMTLPDSSILLRVVPDIPVGGQSKVEIANGVLGTVYNLKALDGSVIVREGEAAFVGGPVNELKTMSEHKTPWLGDLPWVGAAFRHQTPGKQRNHLLIFITPTVEQPAAGDRLPPP